MKRELRYLLLLLVLLRLPVVVDFIIVLLMREFFKGRSGVGGMSREGWEGKGVMGTN